MQGTPLSPTPEDDEHTLEHAQRQAKLHELTQQTRQVLREARLALAEHDAARRRMERAIRAARARLTGAR